MTTVPAQLELLTTHSNEFLFSNHYLGRRLPTRREWQWFKGQVRLYEELEERVAETQREIDAFIGQRFGLIEAQMRHIEAATKYEVGLR